MTVTEMSAGMWLEGYQAQAQAPVSLTPTERTRYLSVINEDRLVAVKGAWSDPWWMRSPESGWAVARRWRSKAQRVFVYGCEKSYYVQVAAIEEYIVEPWETQ